MLTDAAQDDRTYAGHRHAHSIDSGAVQAQLIDDLRDGVAHLRSSQLKGIAGGRQLITDEYGVASEFRWHTDSIRKFV
jgi:hypothetical protein